MLTSSAGQIPSTVGDIPRMRSTGNGWSLGEAVGLAYSCVLVVEAREHSLVDILRCEACLEIRLVINVSSTSIMISRNPIRGRSCLFLEGIVFKNCCNSAKKCVEIAEIDRLAFLSYDLNRKSCLIVKFVGALFALFIKGSPVQLF